MKGVIYGRYSPRPEEKDAIQKQTEDILVWCANHDVQPQLVCFDKAVSGTVPLWDRPGLRAGIEALQPGWCLVVRNLNRIARKVSVALTIEEMVFDDKKAQLVSVEDGGFLSNDRHARFTRTILYAVSDLQREEGNERTSRRMVEQIYQGKMKRGSVPPWGFAFHGDFLVRDDNEQDILDFVADHRRAGGSYGRIANSLNDAGYGNPRNGYEEFDKHVVARIVNSLKKRGVDVSLRKKAPGANTEGSIENNSNPQTTSLPAT